MNTFQKITNDYTSRFIKKVKNINYIEQKYFEYATDEFIKEVNQYEYIDSKFVNLTSNINSSKNICIVDISFIFTYILESKLCIQTYLLSLFSKNYTHIFSFEKLTDKIVIELDNAKLDNIHFLENIDVLSKKCNKYFHYNINKEINFENISIVKNLLSFALQK